MEGPRHASTIPARTMLGGAAGMLLVAQFLPESRDAVTHRVRYGWEQWSGAPALLAVPGINALVLLLALPFQVDGMAGSRRLLWTLRGLVIVLCGIALLLVLLTIFPDSFEGEYLVGWWLQLLAPFLSLLGLCLIQGRARNLS